MATNGTNPAKIPARARLVTAMLDPTCRDMTAAAKAAGVPLRTAHRWAREPAFQAALNRAEEELLDNVTRRLLAMTDSAIAVVILTMAGNYPIGQRLRAALAVMELSLRLKETRDFERRLAALEEAAKL